MIYFRFLRFLLPLAITSFVLEFGSQVLNAGMARVPQPAVTLAAFGLAWGIVLFLTSPLAQAKELGLVLGDGRTARRQARRFVIFSGLILTGGLAALALTRLGVWVIEDLHEADHTLTATVRTVLLWLMPYPLLKGFSLFHAGLLVRAQRTEWVSVASIVGIGASIVAVFVLLLQPSIQAQPIWLPILGVYAGIVVELGMMLWGYWRAVHPTDTVQGPGVIPSFGSILHFFWPLALIMMIQEFSRPLINLYVTRASTGPEALAVLAVAYILGRIPYGWLNDTRNLATSFRHEANSLHYIRRFITGCTFVSLAMMVLLFWTPLRSYVLQTLSGLSPELAELSRTPLQLFVLFPVVVALRAYYHGIGLVERRTQALAPSAPMRLLAIWLALVVLPHFGVTGATLGIAALFCGFALEALSVWWGVRGYRYFLGKFLDQPRLLVTDKR